MRDDKNSPAILLLLFLDTLFSLTSSSSSETEFLILPLTSREMTRVSPNRLPFRHNVSLTVSLAVGSPPQNVTMVLDTGSELSWLRCNRTNTTVPVAETFNPDLSASYAPVQCSSTVCTNRTQDFTIPASCDAKDLCHATLTYADFTSSEGNLAADTFHIGTAAVSPLVFGCMDGGFSSNPDADAESAGLIGMNRGRLSLVSQMSFVIFSYCISSYNLPGVLILGEPGLAPLVVPLNYTALVQISQPLPYFDRVAYTVQLIGITVAGTSLPVPKSVFTPDHTGAGQTMVDSGTQFTFLLGEAYTALRHEFVNRTTGVLKVLEEEDFVFQGAMDLCFRIPVELAKLPELPTVSLVFDGAEMVVNGESLLYPVAGEVRGNDAVYCFTFGNSDLLGVEAYVIGHHHQQNVWMEFDLEKSRIGLAQTRCDRAVQRFGLSA